MRRPGASNGREEKPFEVLVHYLGEAHFFTSVHQKRVVRREKDSKILQRVNGPQIVVI